MKIIETERLLLRDLRRSDWQAVHEYASDPKVVQYMDWGPNTDIETKEFIQRGIKDRRKKPRSVFTLAIVLKADNGLIGSCGIHVSSPQNKEGWFGYCLNRSFWGKGYATETASALVGFGFDHLGLHRIFATCDPANTASAHVLEKSGMGREGHLRQHKWSKGKWRDSYVYAIVEEEWKQIQK
jgi:ribosomal-protein-alanine N-acetyltransferase